MQHQDLTVTSEEKVLNAILMWGMKAKEVCGWEVVDELMTHSTPELLFGDRLLSVHEFLSFVRFPIMPLALLKKVTTLWYRLFFNYILESWIHLSGFGMILQLEKSNISRHVPVFDYFVSQTFFSSSYFLLMVTTDIEKWNFNSCLEILVISFFLKIQQVKEAISFVEGGLTGPEFEQK